MCNSHFNEIQTEACSLMNKAKLHIALVAVQFGFAGFEVLTRAVLFSNSNLTEFTLYRNIVAFAVLGPVALVLERKEWPPASLYLFFNFLLLGFLGVTVNQVSYLLGLQYTSAVYASAMRNLTPMLTLVFGVICRVEKVNIKRRDGIATTVGTVLGLCGAVALTAYQGSVFLQTNCSGAASMAANCKVSPQQEHGALDYVAMLIGPWKIGSIFLVLSFSSFSLSLILQAQILARHSIPISVAALAILSSILELSIMAATFQHSTVNWSMTKETIIVIVYSGTVGSGLVSALQSWGVKMGGPVIVAAYQPLETVLVALLGFIFLKESLHFGSLFGAILIVGGLYLQTWGQEERRRMQLILHPLDDLQSLKQSLLRVEVDGNGDTPCDLAP